MTAVIIGVVFIFLGGLGIVHWLGDLLLVLRGLGPLCIFVGGVIALIAGIASFRPSRANDNGKE